MAIFFNDAEHFSKFGTGTSEKHFYNSVLKSGCCFKRRCHLKVLFPLLALVTVLFKTILAILVQGYNSSKYLCKIILKLD